MGNSMETALSVVIVSWNTRDLLRRCLRSLVDAKPAAGNAQLVVVDNGSCDGTVEMVLSEFPEVELIANGTNVGFAAANNSALRQVRGRYVLFLNPDTEVTAESIAAMVSCLDRCQDVAAVGTTLLNPDGSLQPSCHRFYGFWHSLKHNRLVDRLAGHREMANVNRGREPTEVDWLTGACFAVRRAVLEQVGGFDPDYFVYGEEVDLQYRIKKAGWRILFVPSCGVIHHGGKSARQAAVAASLHDYRGRWLFVRKHYHPASAAAYLIKAMAALALWWVYWSARAMVQPGTSAGREARVYGQLLTWHLTRSAVPPPPAPRSDPASSAQSQAEAVSRTPRPALVREEQSR